MTEIWLPIKDFEFYEISNFGRVRTLEHTVPHAVCSNGYRCQDRILKPSGKRYLKVVLFRNRKRFTRNIHRLVAEAFIPNSNNLPLVCHSDDDKTNNKALNLEWGTSKSNNEQAFKNGKGLIGDNHPRSKLTEEIVLQARILFKNGVSSNLLAQRFGVSAACMYGALTGRTWSHVK